jgi:hypothetical protein
VVPRIHNKADAIEAARNFLSTTWIDEEHCIQGIRCLDSYTKAWDETHGTYRSERVLTGQATEPTPYKPALAASSPTTSRLPAIGTTASPSQHRLGQRSERHNNDAGSTD